MHVCAFVLACNYITGQGPRLTSEGVSGIVCCSEADSGIRPCSGGSTSDVHAVMAT